MESKKAKNGAITRIASCMFAVYVFHVLLVDQVLDTYIRASTVNSYIVFVVYVVVLFFVLLFCEFVRQKLFRVLNTRIYDYFEG